MALSPASYLIGGKMAGISQVELHCPGFLCRSSIPKFAISRVKDGANSVKNMNQTHVGCTLRHLKKNFSLRCVASPEIIEILEEEEVQEDDVVVEEEEHETPSINEIQTLLTEVCDETAIAELNLKVGSFKLKVRREIGKSKEAVSTTPLAPSPTISSKPKVESISAIPAPPLAKKSQTSALSLATLSSSTKPMFFIGLLEAAADEGLEFVTSPKVGLFRKGRVVKGKAGRAMSEEGQVVKEGQVVCYLEQLGTQQPVEAPISGEVVKILWEDGAPVGYADPLIVIRPSFVGIKKLN